MILNFVKMETNAYFEGLKALHYQTDISIEIIDRPTGDITA